MNIAVKEWNMTGKYTVEGLNCVPQVLHQLLSPVAQFKPQISFVLIDMMVR